MESKIIDKVLSRNASPEEAKHVAEWLATEEGQAYLSKRYDRESFLLNEKTIDEWLDHEIPSERMKLKIFSPLRVRIRMSKFRFVAAVLIPFLILVGGFAFVINRSGGLFASSELTEIMVPYGEHFKVILQDGTSVHLNSGSTLSYPKSFGIFNRKVKLSGEGYFIVAEEKTRPFIVNLDEIDIKVTGTKFDAKGYADDTKINIFLEEGGVNISDSHNNIYPMVAGQNAVYDRTTGECTLTNTDDKERYIAWRTKSLNFYRTSLHEILKTLERQYEVLFMIEDVSLLQFKFSISTSKVDIDSILEDLEKVSNIRFDLIDEDRTYKVFSIE